MPEHKSVAGCRKGCVKSLLLHPLPQFLLCCLGDGIGDVAKEVSADLGVPIIAVSDSAAGQAEAQDHELLLGHDGHTLPKGSRGIVAVLLHGCASTSSKISLQQSDL